MAAKTKKVKWALSGKEPDDLQEFKDNDQIIKENKGKLPPKAIYTWDVRSITVKSNKNGDDRINVMCVLQEPKKSDAASWNGLTVFEGFNVTEQGEPWIKRFLKSMGLEWKDFIERTQIEEEGKGDSLKRRIVQIGRVKFGQAADKHPQVKALIKIKGADDYHDSDHVEIQRFIPKDDDAGDDNGADEADAVDMSDEPKKGKGKKDKGDTLSVESLNSMKAKDLIKIATDNGIKAKKVDKAGKDADALRELITKELNLPPF